MAKLVCRSGPASGKEYKLIKDVTLLGRQSSCEVPVDDTMASRAHCQIRRDGHLFTLIDLGSRNGTLHNGRRAGERSLLYGDRIRIGECEYVLVKEAGDPDVRDMLTKYEIVDRLGEGGMGIVYKAVQRSMARTVALKVLAPKYATKSRFVEQFVREARAAGTLNHANIIQVHDVGHENGIHYFSMEFVDGPNCMQVLRESGRFAPGDALEVVKQVAKALEYAHGHRLIHQDIKPDNIMLTAQGQIKLADLGISKTFDEAEADTAPKRVMGTPHYMAPEAALGKRVDHRVDIYSLGATLYHLLTAKTPYAGSNPSEVLKAHVMDAFPSVHDVAPDVPEAVCALVSAMTAKDPDQRLTTASAVIDEISKIEALPGLEKSRIAQGHSGYLRQYADRAAPDRTPNQDPEGTAEQGTPLRPAAKPVPIAPLLIGGGIAALVVVAIVAWPKSPEPTNPPQVTKPGSGQENPSSTRAVVTAPTPPTTTNPDPPLLGELVQIEALVSTGRSSNPTVLANRIQTLLSTPDLPPDLRMRANLALDKINQQLKDLRKQEADRAVDQLERQVNDLALQRNFSIAIDRIDAASKGQDAAAQQRLSTLRERIVKERDVAIAELRGRIARYAKDEVRLRELRDQIPAGLLTSEIEADITTTLQKLSDARAAEAQSEVAKVGALLGSWKLAEVETAHAQLRGKISDGTAATQLDAHLGTARKAREMIQRLAELLQSGPVHLTQPIGTISAPDVIAASDRGLSLRGESGGTIELRWSDLAPADVQRVVMATMGNSGEAFKPTLAAIASLKPAK